MIDPKVTPNHSVLLLDGPGCSIDGWINQFIDGPAAVHVGRGSALQFVACRVIRPRPWQTLPSKLTLLSNFLFAPSTMLPIPSIDGAAIELIFSEFSGAFVGFYTSSLAVRLTA